ncbi:MAG TPA: Crp/Fnr family transcriptional regulator [Pyrinomonadaceae bacterium]
MLAPSRQLSTGNRILGLLPQEELARLVPYLEPVELKKGEIVYLIGDEIQHAYFPENSLLSLSSITETGSPIEVAMVGNEGGVGLPVLLRNQKIAYEVTAQFNTRALRIKANKLQEEFYKGQGLHEFVLRYFNVLIGQISQSSICSRFHTLDKTLPRWLLSVQDRVISESLDLTHENISNALGVPRTAITKAAGDLQKQGLIRYSRGRIFILDRPNLEAHSCECYRILRDQLGQFMNK